MLGELPTPIDEITGQPLAVRLINLTQSVVSQDTNFHHHYHPRLSPELLPIEDFFDTSGLAVRQSRGQELPIWLHKRYHDIFTGPQRPKTRQQKFSSVILNCSGVLPRKVIDLSHFPDFDEERDIIHIDSDEYAQLSSTVHIEKANHPRGHRVRTNIGKFIASYAVEQNLHDIIRESLIDEFLYTLDPIRRREIGNYMLTSALDIALEPVRPVHALARRKGLIVPHKPHDPMVVVKKFFVKKRFDDYYSTLQQALAV